MCSMGNSEFSFFVLGNGNKESARKQTGYGLRQCNDDNDQDNNHVTVGW